MLKGNSIGSFIKGSVVLVVSNVILKAINFFLLPLYTGYLTPDLLGITDTAITLNGLLLPLLTMGMDSAFSAFYYSEDDGKRADKVFSTVFYMLLFSSLISLFMIAFAPNISMIIFRNEKYSILVLFSLMSVCFNLCYIPFSLEIRMKNKMAVYGLIGIVASVSTILLNVLFLVKLDFRENSLLLSNMVVNLLQLILFMVASKKRPRLCFFDKKLLFDMFKFAVPIIPMTMMTWVLSMSDRYVLVKYSGEASVGLYGIGNRFVTIINVFISSMSMAYTTFAFSNKDDPNAKYAFKNIFVAFSVMVSIVAFTISLFGREIVSLMADKSYGESYITFRDLMFSQLFYAMGTIVGYGIYFKKKSFYSLIAVTSAAIVNLVLNIILIPTYGIQAAAFTTLIGYVTQFALIYFFSQRVYRCDYGIIRVLMTVFLLYLVSLCFAAQGFIMKIGVWLVLLVLICFIYKKQLLKFFHLILDKFKITGMKK